MKRIFYAIITILWIALIFSFSLQPGETSSQTSSELTEWIVEEVLPNVIGDVEAIRPEQWEWMHFLLRKGAHFLEYFILGILMNLTLSQTRRKHMFICAFMACVLVASTDETIQRFVSGRSGQISDVLLDSVGAWCGIGLMIWREKRRRNRKKN